MKYVLACCGGGLRGVISACALAELERQTGKLTRDIFSFVSGTSTGALIAAAVAAGLPAEEIVNIYVNRATNIFKHGGLSTPLAFVRGYADDPGNIRKVLSKVMPTADKWTMDDCPLKVLLCATGMNGHNWFFVPKNPKNSGLTGSVNLFDAATASAAAPFYFDHWTMPVNGTLLRFYDGGSGGTANPTYETAIEAFKYDSIGNFDPRSTRIITLGTGFYPAPDVPPSGALDVIRWALDTLVDTSADWVDRATAQLLSYLGGLGPVKLNIQLPKDIDMADVSAIPGLLSLGKSWAITLDWDSVLS